MKIGANYLGKNECEYIVWAVKPESVSVRILDPDERIIQMKREEFDYWRIKAENIYPGTKYLFRINNKDDRPDPASQYQPFGVHSASEVVDHSAFKWEDKNWKGYTLNELIIYELHVGTFTVEGSFEAAINQLDDLADLGITAIELMPVSQFAGTRNWGYDGVYPFAPQNSYGGPEGLKKLINAAHKKGLAVILDVVFNHFGPEGNYVNQFSNYFTPKYKTPWGDAVNFDGEYSDGVRNYFLENARHWLTNYHIDGLRLDAIDTIYDMSAKHFLQELAEEVQKLSDAAGQKKILIAESDLNDIKIIKPISEGGYGIDAQWSDDFHHSIHTLLTGEKFGYYIDFNGTQHLSDSIQNSFVYDGKYSSYRKRRHGNNASGRPHSQFVICVQNHDQIGNRAFGERLSSLVSFEALKLAAGTLILSPNIPLLFMGEEYGEENPFLYFVNHSDQNLIEAVKTGRQNEFGSFGWKGDIPDPFELSTFEHSKLKWVKRDESKHKVLLDFYRSLIAVRKNLAALRNFERENAKVSAYSAKKVISLLRWNNSDKMFSVFNFNTEAVTLMIDVPEGRWKKIFESASERWNGPGDSASESLIGKQQNLTLRKSSFICYEWESN